MSVTRADIQRIARLASLDVDAAAMDDLTRQIAGILDYVDQLKAVPHDGGVPGGVGMGTGHQGLRADEVKSDPLAFPPKVMAPVFKDGLFLVPGHVAPEDE